MDGEKVVYVAQALSARHTMRMFTEVGRRVYAHCTGVGKALLAQLPAESARELVARTGLPAHTSHTITDLDMFMRELDLIRGRGYALDDEEQELGVRCVAVPISGAPTLSAISVSGPSGRLTRGTVNDVVPLLRRAADRLAYDLAAS
jgi:IclR family acetate operon transcriptional repressor